jgi:hypothetical protein
MLEAIAAMVVVLGIGILMAHVLDAFPLSGSHRAEPLPPIKEQRPPMARNGQNVRRRPILHDCGDDRISASRLNETRSLS